MSRREITLITRTPLVKGVGAHKHYKRSGLGQSTPPIEGSERPTP